MYNSSKWFLSFVHSFDIVLIAKLVTLVSDDIVITPTSSLLSFRRATRWDFYFKKYFLLYKHRKAFAKRKLSRLI
jgi:hypothetical protein